MCKTIDPDVMWRRCYTLVISVCFVFVALHVCLRNQRFSYFYSPDLKAFEAQNDCRVRAALSFLRNHSAGRSFTFKAEQRPEMCFAFVVAPRYRDYQTRYLLQSVVSVLASIPRDFQRNVQIGIISSEPGPGNTGIEDRTSIIDGPFISKYVHHWSKRYRSSGEMNRGTLLEETFDYSRALQYCYDGRAPVTIIVEDDAIASKHLFPRIFDILKQIRSTDNNAFYIKLFASEAYFGWENKDIPVMLCAGIFVALCWCAAQSGQWDPKKRRCYFLKERVSTKTYLEISFLIPVTVLLLKVVGKQTVYPPFSNGLHKIPHSAVDSNTVATVFPYREKISPFLKSLNRSVHLPKVPKNMRRRKRADLSAIDLILHHWTLETKQSRYYCIPSLFDHIGLYSSKPWKSLIPGEYLLKGLKNSATFEQASI